MDERFPRAWERTPIPCRQRHRAVPGQHLLTPLCANPITTQTPPEEGNHYKPGSLIPAEEPTTLFCCSLEEKSPAGSGRRWDLYWMLWPQASKALLTFAVLWSKRAGIPVLKPSQITFFDICIALACWMLPCSCSCRGDLWLPTVPEHSLCHSPRK